MEKNDGLSPFMNYYYYKKNLSLEEEKIILIMLNELNPILHSSFNFSLIEGEVRLGGRN